MIKNSILDLSEILFSAITFLWCVYNLFTAFCDLVCVAYGEYGGIPEKSRLAAGDNKVSLVLAFCSFQFKDSVINTIK